MKVLLTGGNGFVGSRILARLAAASVSTVLLLRSTSSRQLIQPWLEQAEVRLGTLEDPGSLSSALEGVTHVVHCAGLTKAFRAEDFSRVNVEGTRHLVDAVLAREGQVRRWVQVSSLAAIGPGTIEVPVSEEAEPHPVSAYGRSKWEGEQVVREKLGAQHIVLRPGGVYGPGDGDFLQLFKTVKAGWSPQFGGGRQPLNLVFVDDLSEVVFRALTTESGVGQTYHVAHPQVLTAGELTQEVARQLGCQPRVIPLPVGLLIPLSWGGELVSRLTGKPGILSVDRRRELMARGWVCDTSRLREVMGVICETSLPEGLRRTFEWYEQNGWL